MKNQKWFAGLINDKSFFDTEAEAAAHCLKMAIEMAYQTHTIELWHGASGYYNGACPHGEAGDPVGWPVWGAVG